LVDARKNGLHIAQGLRDSICERVTSLHQIGYVHGDVRDANIEMAHVD
jgi:tRNA A-37 threonylcarbamoyl transferase component Bud32